LIDVAFRRKGLDASSPRRWVCRPCEQTARDQRKIANRWSVKARDVIRRHALRLGFTKEELIYFYGWEPARLAHDAEFQYANGCNYCGGQYAAMGHGLSDISLDIIKMDPGLADLGISPARGHPGKVLRANGAGGGNPAHFIP
jgi:hypothetical protein